MKNKKIQKKLALKNRLKNLGTISTSGALAMLAAAFTPGKPWL